MHAPNAIRTNGYLDKKSSHPGLLGAAVVLHMGLLGAILSYHPEILIDPEKPIELKQFPPIQQPPLPKADKKPTKQPTKAEPRPQADQRQAIVPTERATETWPEPPKPPPAELENDGGRDIIDPVPVPVWINASSDPRFDRDRQPPYPPALERMEVEGSVTVRVQIGTDGRVTAVELVTADDPGFFTATRDWALKRWRFKPATRDGMAVVTWLTRTVHFRIVRDGNR